MTAGPGRPRNPLGGEGPLKDLAAELRTVLDASGVGAADVAGRIGKSPSSVSGVLNGTFLPSREFVRAFVAACGGSPDASPAEELWTRARDALRGPAAESPASEAPMAPAPPVGSAGGPRLTTPDGARIQIPPGGTVVFGRGPDVDLTVSAGRGLSRRAGRITAFHTGGLIANLSLTHALYVLRSGGERMRLPRRDSMAEPEDGWFVARGSVLIGSAAMLDDDAALQLEVVPHADVRTADPAPSEDSTLLPLTLDPGTKLFLVALLWCRPWLLDVSRTTALPRTPEIARAALEVTGATFELERFTSDPAFRDRLATRVAEHLRALRRKITERGLARPGARLSDEVIVGILLDNSVLTARDLGLLEDPAWLSRQEDLWWDSE